MPRIAALLDKRLLVVTGKGGTGKTTVAAALALAAARAGRRTVVCEVAGGERLPALLGAEPARGGRERELRPGLASVSIDPDAAVEEYLRVQIGSRTLAAGLARNRLFELLAAAAPGLRELVTIGKAWDLAQPERRTAGDPFDLVLVDAPATGHALALLRSPRTFAEVARVGPIRRQAGIIDAFLTDAARTAAVAVALPEEMPVTETAELVAGLGGLGVALGALVANGVLPERFTAAEAGRIEAALAARAPDGAGGGPTAAARDALAAAREEHRRARAQRGELRRLRELARRAPGSPPVATLPFLFAPVLAAPELERLSRDLERRLA